MSLNRETHHEVAKLLYAKEPVIFDVFFGGVFISSREGIPGLRRWRKKFEQPRTFWKYATNIQIWIHYHFDHQTRELSKRLLQNTSYLCSKLNTLFLPALKHLDITVYLSGSCAKFLMPSDIMLCLYRFSFMTLLPNGHSVQPSVSIRGPTYRNIGFDSFVGLRPSNRWLYKT